MSSSEPSGPGSRLSGSDALRLLEIINGCLACNSRADFADLVRDTQELLSCDFSITAMGHHNDREGVVIVDGVNVSFPEQWCVEYKSRNFAQSDPVVRENFTTYRLQRWSETKKRIVITEAQKKIASLCLDFGMKDGYTFGLKPHSKGSNGSMFCFSGPEMENDGKIRAILEYVIPHLHLALSHVSNGRGPGKDAVSLSDREKEVLNWLKLGKSSWDMSVILGISERTVNYHVYNIMQKLDVVNRPQALAVAARMGLIDMA